MASSPGTGSHGRVATRCHAAVPDATVGAAAAEAGSRQTAGPDLISLSSVYCNLRRGVASRAYREIQHDLHAVARDAEVVLHEAAEEVGEVERAAWHDMKEGFHTVANSIDHVIDRYTH